MSPVGFPPVAVRVRARRLRGFEGFGWSRRDFVDTRTRQWTYPATGDVRVGLLALAPLAAIGEPTMTHGLLPDGFAIDTISEAECIDAGSVPLMTDQRWDDRPVAVLGMDAKSDVDAFRVQP